MIYKKQTDKVGIYTKVYFTDDLGRKQGAVECFITKDSQEPRLEDLYYTEQYLNGIPQGQREYTKFLKPEETEEFKDL
ncbi:MAG TPA: hypothetical protein VK766_06640 [Cytophagaceae bacterium]|jgi:hypothetical protein|nr:hypothetical protein [Cytophagaceae bacterium]